MSDLPVPPSLQDAIDQILVEHHRILKQKLFEVTSTGTNQTVRVFGNELDARGESKGKPVRLDTKTCEDIINAEVLEVNAVCERPGSTSSTLTSDYVEAPQPQPQPQFNRLHGFHSELSSVSRDAASSVLKTRHNINELEEFVRGKKSRLDAVISCMDKMFLRCAALQEPPRSGYLADIVTSRMFEVISSLVICCNTLITIVDTNWQMQNESYNSPAALQTLEMGFTSCYFVEVVLKILVHRCFFFINEDWKWNTFDFLLAVLGLVDVFVTLFFSRATAFFSPVFVRIVRLLRVLKKVSRVVRLLQFFTDLRLMMQCVLGSIFSLFWSIVLLGGFFVVFSIIFVQQLTSAVVDNRGVFSRKESQSIHDRFGSVQLGVLSLFQCVAGGADWAECYTVVTLAGWFSTTIFLVFILLTWLSLTNIITSIFVDKAMRLAQPHRDQLLLAKRREELGSAQELRNLFSHIDRNNSKTVTKQELQESMKDDALSSYFELKGLDVQDISMFCDMLADMSGNGEIDADTFIAGCLRMKGLATSIDLLALHHEMRTSQRRLMQSFMKSALRMESSCRELFEKTLSVVNHAPYATSAQPDHCRACSDAALTEFDCHETDDPPRLDSVDTVAECDCHETDLPIYKSSYPIDLQGAGFGSSGRSL